MTALIVAMLVCIGVAAIVVAAVAVPARREGRHLLTSRGEDVVARAMSARSSLGRTPVAAPQTPPATPSHARDAMEPPDGDRAQGDDVGATSQTGGSDDPRDSGDAVRSGDAGRQGETSDTQEAGRQGETSDTEEAERSPRSGPASDGEGDRMSGRQEPAGHTG